MHPRTAMGLICLAGYVVHACALVRSGHPAELLWACHVGDLLVGLGLLTRLPRLSAIGLLWLLVGTPAWLLDLARGAELAPTSILTHVGGVLVGWWAARRFGLPRGSAWLAVATLLALALLCRQVTPPSENVNMSFHVWDRWADHLPASFTLTAALALAAHLLAFRFVEERLACPTRTAEVSR